MSTIEKTTVDTPDDVDVDQAEEIDETEEAADQPAETASTPGVLAGLRPYLPDRNALASLYAGSVELSQLLWTWRAKHTDWRHIRNRGACVLTGIYVMAYEAHHSPFVLPAVGVTWCAAAWYLSPAVDQDDEAVIGQDDDAGPGESDDEPTDRGNALALARPGLPPLEAELVARMVRETAADHGWLGVHLDTLLTRLPGRSKKELTDCLAAAAIQVHPGFKLSFPNGPSRNRQGVRVDALPPGLGQAPPAPAPATAEEGALSLVKASPTAAQDTLQQTG